MSIKIALAGNPNSGKTTLFNALTGSSQYVGNWPGVTVEKKEGKLKGNKDIIIQDLPGIYSLSPYTLEEVVSRNYLIDEKPDAIINIIDATNLERNLYLTTQLLEIGIPVIVALNMMDLVKKRGDNTVNTQKLSKELGCQVVEISALKGQGTKDVADKALTLAKAKKDLPKMATFSDTIEASLKSIEDEITGSADRTRLRWYAIKLFERDSKVELKLSAEKKSKIESIITDCEKAEDDDSESLITNERYTYISKILGADGKQKRSGALSTSDKIDRIVTNRILALPIFAAVMFLVYWLAIGSIGTIGTDWVNDVLFGEWIPDWIGSFLETVGANEVITGLILDGIVAGVGAVLGFVPQMIVLFLCLAILEDIGYMARVAFVMDRIFRKFGLSGKSFIPIMIGIGCGVPGVMASRTIENESDRKMTIMTTTFIPCGAKLPIIAMIAGALFGGSAWIAFSAWAIGLLAIVFSGIILKKTKPFVGEPSPFVMELPAYHVPSVKGVLLTMWDRTKSFIKRAGTIILLAAIVIWFLQSFGFEDGSFGLVDMEDSLLATIGKALAFIFIPLGFGEWISTVATFTGLVAKEVVVGTLGVLMAGMEEVAEDGSEIWSTLQAHYMAMGHGALSAYAFMAFNLLCAPCFAAIGAIRREMGNAKWTWIAIGYQTIFAYCVALCIYNLGVLFTGGGFTVWTAVAIVIVILFVYLLFRKPSAPNRLETPKKEKVTV